MEMRFDTVPIKAVRNDAGYIIDTPVLTRTGVFEYRDPHGKVRREYRPPDVVFAADSLAGYKGLPITDGHPGFVNAKNVKSTLVGTVISPGRADGQNLVAEVVIHDPAPVDQGRKELSVGYEVAFDETPGTSPEGEAYDATQIKIVPNHLALVLKGRAGTARLNLDAADVEPQQQTPPPEKPNMSLIKVKVESTGLSYDAAPEIGQEVERLRTALKEAQTKAETQAARADSAEATVATLKANEAKIREDAAEAVKQRMALESVAAQHKCEIRQDATDRQIREAVIKAVRGDAFNLDGKSDDYVAAAYDLAVSESAKNRENVADSRRQMAPGATPPAGGAAGSPPAGGMNQDAANAGAGQGGQVYSAAAAREAYRAKLRGQGAQA